MTRIENFQEIEIWIIAKNLAVIIYKISSKGIFHKDFSLKDQLRRSTVSISSNIAEGFGRGNNKEFIYFLRIAKASCLEAITQITIAFEIGYITNQQQKRLIFAYEELTVKISKFITYLRNYKNSSISK